MIEKIDDPDVLDIVLKHRNKAGRRMEDTAVSVRRMYTFWSDLNVPGFMEERQFLRRIMEAGAIKKVEKPGQ